MYDPTEHLLDKSKWPDKQQIKISPISVTQVGWPRL